MNSKEEEAPFHQIFLILVVIAFLLFLTCIPYLSSSTEFEKEIEKKSASLYHSAEFDTSYCTAKNRNIIQYDYFSYSTMTAELNLMNSTWPNLVDLTTAQDRFGLSDCADGYKVYILRITNESRVRDTTPEVLFLGGIHGNEAIAVPAAMYLARTLLDNYRNDSYIRHLVDTREIYIIPCLNPYGLEENVRVDGDGEDLNRDFSYDPENIPFTTIGAHAVHLLMSEHLFISGVNWHSGIEAIGYAWGVPAHDTDSDECPDDAAFHSQGFGMRNYAGSYSGYYPTGRNNQVIYWARGAFSDYAYAASWDAANNEPGWNTDGCRSLGYTVEISSTKEPSITTFGTSEDIYTPGGNGDGYISKNIRLGLYVIDTISPYVTIHDNGIPEGPLLPGESFELEWIVGGCEEVDKTTIAFGSDPDPFNNSQETLNGPMGESSWEGKDDGGNPYTLKKFRRTLNAPDEPGTYYYIISSQVDGFVTDQNTPDPEVEPQSYYANLRSRDNYEFTNGENRLICKKNFTSKIFSIQVQDRIEIIDYPLHMNAGSIAVVNWTVNIRGEIQKTNIAWGDEDPLITSGSELNGTLIADSTYSAAIDLPDSWGSTYVRCFAENSTGHSAFSDMVIINTSPHVSIISLNETSLKGNDTMVVWSVQGADHVDETRLICSYNSDSWDSPVISIGPYSGNPGPFESKFTLPNSSGLLYLRAEAKVNGNDTLFTSQISSIILYDLITISQVNIDYSGGDEQKLDINKMTLVYSEKPTETAGLGPIENSTYTIEDILGSETISGNMSFDENNGSWYSLGIDVSSLQEGTHTVIFNFTYLGKYIQTKTSYGSSFIIDHIVNITNHSSDLDSDLNYQIKDITLNTSKSDQPHITNIEMVSSRIFFEGYEDGKKIAELDYGDMLTFNDISKTWQTGKINLSGVIPGIYRAILEMNTVFDSNIMLQCTVTIPSIPSISFTIAETNYTGLMSQTLSLKDIEYNIPEILLKSAYNGLIIQNQLVFEMGLLGGENNLTRIFDLQLENNMAADLNFNMSFLPSGVYMIEMNWFLTLSFPMFSSGNGELTLTGTSLNGSHQVQVLHVYRFTDEPVIRVVQNLDINGTYRGLDIFELNISGSRNGNYQDSLTVTAEIYDITYKGVVLKKTHLRFSSTSGNWSVSNWDISDLDQGDYFIIFKGKLNGIEFHSDDEDFGLKYFSVKSTEPDEMEPKKSRNIPTVWIFILILIPILMAIGFFIFLRIRRKYEHDVSREEVE